MFSSTTLWVNGDSLDILRSLPDESVDLFVTSPPYLRKVSYLPADHPDKGLELGIEERPADFIENLLTHADEWWRVLRSTGSIAIDLGDTFSGSGGAGGDHNPGGLKEEQRKYAGTAAAKRKHPEAWPGDKGLCMIPEAFRLGLAYGMNPMRREANHERWLVRNVVTLCQQSPKPGRQGDKFWPATTDMVVACKSGTRTWNEDIPNPSLVGKGDYPKDFWVYKNRGTKGHPAGWNPDIVAPIILAMTPPGAVVLDPFAGSGTTVRCAADHGRIGIGLELNPEFNNLAADVCGMFLQNLSAEELALGLKARNEAFGL